MGLNDTQMPNLKAARRYPVAELVDIGRRGGAFVDFSKFAPDALNSGVLCFRTIHPCSHMYPLGVVPGNRIRGVSANSSSTVEDQVVLAGSTIYPIRQPENAPQSGLAQKDEGFARFLKQHSSPTHQRVTAGGRIVPMSRPQPPPVFCLDINNQQHIGINPDTGFFTAARVVQDNSIQTAYVVGSGKKPAAVKARSTDLITAPGTFVGEEVAQVQTAPAQTEEPTDIASGKNEDEKQTRNNVAQSQSMSNMWFPYASAPTVYMPALMHGQILGQNPLPSYAQNLFYQPNLQFQQGLDAPTNPAVKSVSQQFSSITTADATQGEQRGLLDSSQVRTMSLPANTGYGMDLNFAGGYQTATPSAQIASLSGPSNPFMLDGTGYPVWAWQTSSMASMPGLYATPQIPTLDHGSMSLASGFEYEPSFENTSKAQSLRGASLRSKVDPSEIASNKFETLSRHLRELDQFMAIHANKLSAKVKEEKVRERISIVGQRSRARDEMKALSNASKPPSMRFPIFDSTMSHPDIIRPPISEPIRLRKAPSVKTLNVQAPPWTPHEVRGGISLGIEARGDKSTQKHFQQQLTEPSHASDDYNPGEILDEFNDQDSVTIQISKEAEKPTSLTSLTHNPANSEIALIVSSIDSRSSNVDDATCADEGTQDSMDSAAVDLAPRSNEYQGIHLSPHRQIPANHEMILDALRLPAGCITKVNIIGGAETLVHGQGLKQPPWNQMADHEREYWKHKPDYIFFRHGNLSETVEYGALSSTNHTSTSYPSTSETSAVRIVPEKDMTVTVDTMATRQGCVQGNAAVPFELYGTGRDVLRSDEDRPYSIMSQGDVLQCSTHLHNFQQPKGQTSVATSAINAQAKIQSKDGGQARSKQDMVPSCSQPKSPSANKVPRTPRATRAPHDLRSMPFFRGFLSYGDEIHDRLKAAFRPP